MAKKTQPLDLGRLSTPAGFNIPKIKKIKSTAVLNCLPPSDRGSLELVREVDRTCLDPDLKIRKQWKVTATFSVSPSPQVETRYREKRAEMKEQGGGRLQQEVLGFYICRNKVMATDIAKMGIKINPFVKGCLGDPAQGVYLFRYLDVALLSQKDLKSVCIMVFKVLQGRSKQVPVSELLAPRAVTREPTPNFDCHVSQSAPRNGESHHTLCNKSQMYVYEYTDDAEPAEYPRQCLPFAVLEFMNHGMEMESGARKGGPKNFYASAANAGWMSNPRTLSEIRKAGSEPFGPVSKETNYASKPIEPLISLPTPLLTLSTAEGKESFPSVSSQNSESGFDAQRVALDLKGQSMDVVLNKTADLPSNPPAHGKGLHFNGPGDWNAISDGGIQSASHPVSFTGPRDPRLQRLSACDNPNTVSSAQPFLLNRTAGNVINGHQNISAQNPLTLGRANSVPSGVLHDSNISVIDPRLLLQERSTDDKTFIRQLSESSCGFQTDRESSASRVPVLNLVPAKSALKKPTAPLPTTSPADVKKKKTLSFQDYLKKKKAEASTPSGVKDTADSASLSVSGDKTETDKCLTSSKEEHLLATKIPAVPRKQEFQGCDYNPPPDLSHTNSGLKDDSAVSHSPARNKPNDEVHRPVQAVTSENKTLFSGQKTSVSKNKIFSKDPRRVSSDGSTPLKPDVCKTDKDVGMRRGIEGPPAKSDQEKENKSTRKCFQEMISESEAVKKTLSESKTVLQEKRETDKKCVAEDLSSDLIDGNHQVLFADIEDTENENALSVFLDESPLVEESECSLEIALETVPAATNDVPANETLLKKQESCLNKSDTEKCETKITVDKTESKQNDQEDCLREQSQSWKGVNKFTKETKNETLEQRCSDRQKLEAGNISPEHNFDQKQLASLCKSALGQSSNQHDCDDNVELPSTDKQTEGKSSSFKNTRNLSPSSASSVQTSSCIDSSKESTPDVSASVSPETRCNDVEANGSGQEDDKRSGSKVRKRQTAKSKQSGRAADAEVPADVYALVRLAKGLRPGRGIQVEGLGKNPTDAPLPDLEGRRRKKSNQDVKKKAEEKKVAVKEETLPELGEATDKKPKRKRKAALGRGRKKGKRQKTAQEPASPQIDDDIDYTDFQFEDPQEFCVSIRDDLEAVNDRSASPTTTCPPTTEEVSAQDSRTFGSVVVKIEPEEHDLCDWGKVLPLSSLGLHHWTEALVQPRLDPRVELVDLFKVSPGVVDFDNCTICQKVIDQSLIEDDDHTDSASNLAATNQRSKDVSSLSSAATIPNEESVSSLAVNCTNSNTRLSAAVPKDRKSPSLDSAASAEGGAVLSEKSSSVVKHDNEGTQRLDQLEDNLVSSSTIAVELSSSTKHTDTAARKNNSSLFVSSFPDASVASSVRGGVLFEKLSSVVAQTDNDTRTQSVDEQIDNSSGLSPLPDNVNMACIKEVSDHLPSSAERTNEKKEGDDSKLSDKKGCRSSAESTMTSMSQAATNEEDSSKEIDRKLTDTTVKSIDKIVKDATKNNFEQRSLSCVENSPSEMLSKSTIPDKKHENEMNQPLAENMKPVQKSLQAAIATGEDSVSLKTAVSSSSQTDVHKSAANVLISVSTSSGEACTLVDDPKSSKKLPFPSTGNIHSPSQKIYLQQNAKPNSIGTFSPKIQSSQVSKSTRPRPSLGVCSQGSTKQRWQLWKSNQALQMKGNNVCNRENEKQNSSSYDGDETGADSEPHQLMDTVVNKNTVSETRDDCVARDNMKLPCSQDGTSEQKSPVVYENHAAQDDSHCVGSVASGSSQSNQSTSWLETGYWLGINELASLHQPEKGNTTQEDGSDIYSRSVPKISPSKLSQFVPEKITSPSVPVSYPKPKPDQSYQNYIGSSVDDFHHHTTSEQTVSIVCLQNSEALQPTSVKMHDSDHSVSSARSDGNVQSTEMFNSSNVLSSGDFQQAGISPLTKQLSPETDDLVSSVSSESISEKSDHFGSPQVNLPALPWETSTKHTFTPEGTGRQSGDDLGDKSSIVSQQDNPTACLGEKADVSLKDDSQLFDGIIKKKTPLITQSSIPGLDLVRKLKSKESNSLNQSVLSILGDTDLTTALKGILKTVAGVESNGGNLPKKTSDCLDNPKGDEVHRGDQDRSTEKQNQFDTVTKTVSDKLCDNSAEINKEDSQKSIQSNSLSTNESKCSNEEFGAIGTASQSKYETKSLSFVCETSEKSNQKTTGEVCAINSGDEKTSSISLKLSKKTEDEKFSDQNGHESDDDVGGLEDGFSVPGCPIPSFTRERNIAKKIGNNDKIELNTQATSEKEDGGGGFNRSSVPLNVTRCTFPARFDQPPPPGTDPQEGTALNNRGQLSYNLPSQQFAGPSLYHQPVVESPVFVPTMPMPVPCALVQGTPYGQSLAQPLFTAPPPPLASTVAGIDLTIPPPVTVSYPEVVAKQTQNTSESIGDSAAFHPAVPCETSISKPPVQPNENADVNTEKSQSKEKIDVITWFTNREAATRNPPKKDLMDWFSDIIDTKRNTPSVHLEPELKKAQLDFMESLNHKRSLSCRKRSLSSDSDESTDCKKQVDTSKVSFRIGSSDRINKRKGPLRKSVNFDSDSDSDESVISKEASKDSYDATSSSVMNKLCKESADGHGKTDAKSCNVVSTEKNPDSGRNPKEDVKPDKSTGHNNKKRLHSRWDQRESSSKKSKIESKDSPLQSNTKKQVSLLVSKTPKPKNDHIKTDGSAQQDSKVRASHIEHNDTDDDMNDYALALLEGDHLTVKSLETISNKISDSILKSVSSTSKPPKSCDRLLSPQRSSAVSMATCDQKQTKSEKSKSSLTDKPLEFLLFAKEMIMQKLQEVEGGSVNKSMTDMQADDEDQSISEACPLPQDASPKLQSRVSHTVQSESVSAGGQKKAKLKDMNCKSGTLTPPSIDMSVACASVEVNKNSGTQKNPLSACLAADMSAVTEDEINKLKNIVCQLSSLPPASDDDKHTDTVEQSGNERKNKVSGVSGNDHIGESSGVKEKKIQDRPKKTGSAGRDWSLFLTKPRSSQIRDFPIGSMKRNYYGDIIQSPLSLDKQKPVERPHVRMPAVTSLSRSGVKSASSVTNTPTLVSEASSNAKMSLSENARCSWRPKQSAESVSTDRSVVRKNERATVFQTISEIEKTKTNVATKAAEQSDTFNAKTKSHGNVTATSKCITQEASGAKSGNSSERKSTKPHKADAAIKECPTLVQQSKISSMPTGSSQQKVSGDVASMHQPRSSAGGNGEIRTKSVPVLLKEQDKTTLKDLLLEKFPGEDPNCLVKLLDYELTADVNMMSNKTKKNILFRVRKHLDSKTASGTSGNETPSCSAALPIRELLLEEFAADQIELELRLVEGCMRLLEATQQIQSTFDEVQTNSTDQSLKNILPKNSQLTVRDAFTMVVQDFNNAIKDARRNWRGRPHQRVPSELLFSEEQGKLYTTDGVFVVLLSTIPTKPFAKLLQCKQDTEACLTKMGQAACGNKTFVLQQEKQRLELLRTQRKQTLRTFTGIVSQSRLNKVTVVRDNYATSRYQLLRVLGHESVAKMVYFRASYEAIQNHVQIIEGEMQC